MFETWAIRFEGSVRACGGQRYAEVPKAGAARVPSVAGDGDGAPVPCCAALTLLRPGQHQTCCLSAVVGSVLLPGLLRDLQPRALPCGDDGVAAGDGAGNGLTAGSSPGLLRRQLCCSQELRQPRGLPKGHT